MKAVFLNDNYNMDKVYPQQLVNEIKAVMDLYPIVIRKDALSQHAEALRSVDVIFSTWGMPSLSSDEIGEFLPKVKVVFYGAGSVQGFARPFLSRGIKVVSAWAANAVPVIEFCSSIITLSLKGIFPALQAARTDWNGARNIVEKHHGGYNSTVGLLGLGMIGRGVAEKLADTDVRLIAYDPYVPDEVFDKLGIRRADTIQEVFSGSDAVSNHIANLPQTREILRYKHFSAMPEYGAFINTGRNAQVHVPGLVRAFTEVPTRTAFFDVLDPDEPPSEGNPLLALPNVWFTPHMAGSAGSEVQRMGAYMVEELYRFMRGEPLRYEVTEKMLQTMA